MHEAEKLDSFAIDFAFQGFWGRRFAFAPDLSVYQPTLPTQDSFELKLQQMIAEGWINDGFVPRGEASK